MTHPHPGAVDMEIFSDESISMKKILSKLPLIKVDKNSPDPVVFQSTISSVYGIDILNQSYKVILETLGKMIKEARNNEKVSWNNYKLVLSLIN